MPRTLQKIVVSIVLLASAYINAAPSREDVVRMQQDYARLQAQSATPQSLRDKLNAINSTIDSSDMKQSLKQQFRDWVADQQAQLPSTTTKTAPTSPTPGSSTTGTSSSSSSSSSTSTSTAIGTATGSGSSAGASSIGTSAGMSSSGKGTGTGSGSVSTGSGVGIGGTGTGTGSGSGTGAVFGAGTGKGGDTPSSEEIPTAPPLAPSFTPASSSPIKPKPTTPKPTGQLNPLTEAELKALSQAEKDASDALFVSIVQDLSAIQRGAIAAIGADSEPYNKLIEKDLAGNKEAYLKFIITALAQLNKQQAFKKRGELSAFINDNGSFSEFMKNVSSDTDILQRSYTDLEGANTIATSLRNLFVPSLFDATKLPLDLIENIYINILVSMRPIPTNVKPVAAGKSDRLVLDILRALCASPAVKKETDARIKFEKDNPKSIATPVMLDKDYVNQLYTQLNHLRTHPQFLKFNSIFSPMMRSKAPGKSAVDQVKLFPLLDQLLSTDQKTFLPKNIAVVIKAQTLFNGDDFNEVLPEGNPALRIVLEDHIERLIQQQGELDICAFLEERIISKVNDAKGLQAVLKALKAKVQSKQDAVKNISTLQQQFSSLEPNDKTIDAALLGLTGNNTNDTCYIAVHDVFITILDGYKKSTAQVRAVISLVTNAQKQFKASKGQRVGTAMIQALEKDPTIKLTHRQSALLHSLYREANDVYTVFQQLAGSDRLSKVASIENFYALIEPYGLLLKIFDTLPEETHGKSPEDTLTILTSALESLNTGTIRSDAQDLGAIKKNRGLITSNTYKDLLTPMITAVAAADLDTVKKETDALAKAGGIDVVKNQEYKELMERTINFLATISFKNLVNNITLLNKGEGDYAISSLPLDKGTSAERHRNGDIYHELKGVWDPLLNVIAIGGKPTDPATLDITGIHGILDSIQKRTDTILSKEPIAWVNPAAHGTETTQVIGYFDKFVHDTLAQLTAIHTNALATKAAATKPATPEVSSEETSGGIPDAPPMEIPEAPPI